MKLTIAFSLLVAIIALASCDPFGYRNGTNNFPAINNYGVNGFGGPNPGVNGFNGFNNVYGSGVNPFNGTFGWNNFSTTTTGTNIGSSSTTTPSSTTSEPGSANPNVPQRSEEEKKIFREWRRKHKKMYKSHAEEQAAMEKFFKNMEAINAHNKLYDEGKVSFSRGLWEFSDLSREEKERYLRGLKNPNGADSVRRPTRQATSYPQYPTGPDSIDWNERGLVGPVQNQGETLIVQH